MVAPNKSGITSIILKSTILHLCGENSSLLFTCLFLLSLVQFSYPLISNLQPHFWHSIAQTWSPNKHLNSGLWQFFFFFKCSLSEGTLWCQCKTCHCWPPSPRICNIQLLWPGKMQHRCSFLYFCTISWNYKKNRIITLDGYLWG